VQVLESQGLSTVMLDKVGDNQLLVPALEDAGITVVQLSLSEFRNACSSITDAFVNGRLKHKGQEPLTVAVLGAGKRMSGEQFVWSASKSTTDVVPLRAATVALAGHLSNALGDYDVLKSFY
jgi:hypothetical protein